MIRLASALENEDYLTWGNILSITDIAKVAEELEKTFKDAHISLSVPLMIDYEYWFRNTVDAPLVHQIDNVYRHVVRPFAGRIHPFVPFDPVREIAYRKEVQNPDGGQERDGSLDLVKEAIENKGFIGVKIYNSVGYRPWDNTAVDTERRSLFRRIGLERYAAITGEEIDDVLDELYAYCTEHQVPITAHCVANGIESYDGASYVFCSPGYWRPVLERHPTLHLNLAHFGWSDNERYSSTTPGGGVPWVKEICGMLNDYPFVYADVAHHEAFRSEKRAGFLSDYKLMLPAFPGLIQKKLLFGIDWHVITRVSGYRDFVPKYLQLLNDTGHFSSTQIEDFLGGNALQFLGLLKTETPAGSGWSKNRERLRNFYERNEMEPPEWFVATE